MAYNDGISLGTSGATAAQPRDKKPAEEVLATAERLNNRLQGMLSNLRDLRERVSGATPEQPGTGEMASAFALSGFVGGAGRAIEHSHSLLGECESEVGRIISVI